MSEEQEKVQGTDEEIVELTFFAEVQENTTAAEVAAGDDFDDDADEYADDDADDEDYEAEEEETD